MQSHDLDRDSGRWSPPLTASPDTIASVINDTRDAGSVLRTLQHSADNEELKTALSHLSTLFYTVPKFLEKSRAYLIVISTMTHMSSDLEIQKAGLDILHQFMRESPVMDEKMKRSDMFKHLVRLMSDNSTDSEILSRSLRVLINLLNSDHVKRHIAHTRLWSCVLEALMTGMTNFPHQEESVTNALIITLLVVQEDPTQREAVARKHFPVFVQILNIFDKSSDIVLKFLDIFIVLALDEKVKVLVVNSLPSMVIAQTSAWQEESVVVARGFHLLEILCTNDSVCQMLVEKDLIMRTILPEIMSKIEDPDIQLCGLKIFVLCATRLFKRTAFGDLASQWLKIIYLSMSRHMDKPDIQGQGCKALSKLLECKPEVYMWIGESSELKQDPVHTLCLGAILMYEKNEDVYVSACKAIYYLTADNDGLCKTLMEKNSHIAIIEGLRCHRTNQKAITASCRAIRGLSIFQTAHKEAVAVYDGDLLHLLVEIIRSCPDVAEVQSEVISTIACLADVDLFRHQTFVVGMHLQILSAMDNFPGDEILQEAAIEALAVLGGAASGPEYLHSKGAVNKIIKCMKRFVYNANIQKKGLMAIQILAKSELIQSMAMCQELATIIKSIMRNYASNLVLQKEAIVAMQILAERGVEEESRDLYSHMAEVLVNQECHELLFQILEKFDNDRGLHDLASECLYVLGVEQDLKSRMLLTACSRGFIAGAECLVEVGADVNIGHSSESPLYYAVSNNDEKMVQFLLSQEVRDVQSSLKLSLEREIHRITGMLLSHIGQDRETGTVLWSNLNLCDLQPEWILPTLHCNWMLSHSSSTTSKHFVAKIKDSQQRRNQRIMRHCPSESSLEYVRNKCFRFRRRSLEVSHMTFEAIQDLHAKSLSQERQRRPTLFPRLMGRQRSRKRIMGKDLIFKVDRDPYREYHSNSTDITEEEPSSLDGLPEMGKEEIPVFELSEDELQDWRETTLTGANIPFSPADPRQIAEETNEVDYDMKNKSLEGKWQRKFHSDDSSESIPMKMFERCISAPAANHSEESPQSMGVSDQPSSDTESGPSRQSSSVAFLSDEAGETDFETSTEDPKSRRQTLYLIRTLDVSFNHISSLGHLATDGTDLMQSFGRMQHLDLSHNDLESIPEQIFKSLTGLETLNLGSNRLAEFPELLYLCGRLVVLDISSNKITNVSLTTSRSFTICELHLSKNDLTSFPEGLDLSMPNLTYLDISCNKLTSLPQEPCEIYELRTLDFSHNSVRILPDDFLKNCVKLETLIAVNNGLESLPSECLASTLTRMCTVKLFNNMPLEKEPFYIPRFILELPNVRTVDLSSCGIQGFPPPSMWKTQMLKDLIMSRNNIAKLNLEGARAWAKLEKLQLSHNKIPELPREIGQLSSLQTLDLSNNKTLTTFPDELGRCSRLWEMPMEGLNLDLDDALIRGRVKDLIMYLHNRLKKARHYYRMKLMVVGYGGRGKTSLLQALKRKIKNSAHEKPPVTVGVIVDEWKYERQRFNKNVMYILNTWDFAGQEEFYSTHQCFLSNRTLYLAVYDISMGTDEIDKLKPWLSNIHARAPGCPVVVVGTHYDLLPQDDREVVVGEFEEKLKELTQKPGFPTIQCFAIVDLTKETPELEQLRKRVKDIIDDFKIKGQPVMGQKVPASYVRLGEILSEEAKSLEKSFPVIRHGHMLRLVRSANLDLDEEELKLAIDFLHESGVLLHYNETALQMRDFYFINPGWLCRMMAQVVTVPQINPFIDRNGIMKRSKADQLFTGKEISGETRFTFPTQLIPQYLHLLERFEIALPRNDKELLIPSRLPYRRPTFHMPVQNKEDLVFRYYVMPYTPLGFWSRLLTRLIVFAESKGAKDMLYLSHDSMILYWMEGIYVKWSQNAFFLLESHRSDCDEVHLTVPNTVSGCRLLGYLVDHVDSLVDEWYPGLTSIDPLMGQELMEKFVPCTLCTGHQPYLFRVEDLLTQSEKHSDIYCPMHEGKVELAKLAPDVMLADIEPNFHLKLDKFEFKDSPEHLCGDGGFGSVYKAKYKGKTVAVKVFSAIGDIHPHKMLRQEATILRRLKHPSVIALVAVAVRPVRLVVMEYAPSKSLGEVFKSGVHLSRTLKLKISMQIAEGLDYLHNLLIIYRDMKPDNVLIFTLAPDALINAKITDYGISQFTTLFGLTAQEGTPAYRAPEVIRGETYSYQADVFSLGVLMYMVVTGGIHPFDELEFKSEIDKAFADNQPIPPLIQRGCSPWPDFQDLISQCLNQLPDHRPKAHEVFKRLKLAELFSLREIIHVSVGTTVECIASQHIGNKGIRLWVASGDNEYMQLTWLNLLDYKDESLYSDRSRQSYCHSGMGTMFRDGRVLCILPLNQEFILLGTQAGKIWVFNTVCNELVHSTQQLQDSVLSLYLVQRKHPRTSYRGDDPLVLAGLANGKLALYPMSEILQESESDMKPIEMKLGESFEPIRCILRCSNHKLLASCGTRVIVMNTSISVAVESIFNTKHSSNPASQPVTSMACGRYLYLAHRSSNILEAWDYNHGKLKLKFNISTNFKLNTKDGRITAMALHDKTLWVGTGGGQIVLIDVNNWTPIVQTHRHTASIRCLLNVKLRGSVKFGPNSRSSVLLSGGLGFTTRSAKVLDRESHYGCIGVWDADFPQTLKQLSDWSRKRTEYTEKSSPNPNY